MQNISMSDAELLKYAIEHGMIDTTYVQDMIEMQKRKEILEKHQYSIWEGKNGKWYTYLPDEEKNRGKVLKKRKYIHLMMCISCGERCKTSLSLRILLQGTRQTTTDFSKILIFQIRESKTLGMIP